MIVVGFDVDDVVANLLQEWVDRYNAITFDSVKVEDIKGWDVSKYMTRLGKDKVYQLLADPKFYLDVQPHVGALEMVNEVRAMKDTRVVFITSCMFPTHGDQKLQWLIRHGFFGAEFRDVDPIRDWKMYSKFYEDYFPVRNKGLVKADVLVDDNVDNCRKAHNRGVLVSRPHNLDQPTPENSVRAPMLNLVPVLVRASLF